MWAYFKGAMRDIGHDEGATTVAYVPEKGWFWYIPLQDDMVSAGIVGERAYLYREGKDPQAIIDREIQVNPWIAQHLASSSQIGEVRVTSDFSYRAKYCASDGLVLTGDAFAFLDPVFSSGVFMALKSGELAADAVHGALETGDVRAEQFAEYSNQFCTGLEAMRKLVYAFYDPTFSFGKMLKKHPEVRGELTDCLIGNLYRDFEPLFSAVSEFAQVPAPLSYGQPKVSTK
jgi:flavin-dependent dehydrogenase